METVRGHVMERLTFHLVLWAVTAAAPVGDTKCNPFCFNIYTPICGTDGETYANLCEMKIASCRQQKDIAVAYWGACQNSTCLGEQPVCHDLYNPVCGSDGRTYPSACELQIARCQQVGKEELTIEHAGVCKNQDVPVSYPCDRSAQCKTVFVPVCGSDRKTYANACLLGQENCRKSEDERVRVVYVGACKESDTKRTGDPCSELETCSENTRLVCGSDGKTYTNICQLRAANCSSSGVNITLAYIGTCEKTQNEILSNPCTRNPNCGEIFEPVCGSDGKTYNHTCFLDSVNCNHTDIGEITIIHMGHCNQPKEEIKDPCAVERIGCPRHYRPVCGTDGVTYDNECLFHEANCARAPGDRMTLVPLEKCET